VGIFLFILTIGHPLLKKLFEHYVGIFRIICVVVRASADRNKTCFFIESYRRFIRDPNFQVHGSDAVLAGPVQQGSQQTPADSLTPVLRPDSQIGDLRSIRRRVAGDRTGNLPIFQLGNKIMRQRRIPEICSQRLFAPGDGKTACSRQTRLCRSAGVAGRMVISGPSDSGIIPSPVAAGGVRRREAPDRQL
jgi:hypothetical protein